jgi:hypothetical protein
VVSLLSFLLWTKKGFENRVFEIRVVVKYPPFRTNIYRCFRGFGVRHKQLAEVGVLSLRLVLVEAHNTAQCATLVLILRQVPQIAISAVYDVSSLCYNKVSEEIGVATHPALVAVCKKQLPTDVCLHGSCEACEDTLAGHGLDTESGLVASLTVIRAPGPPVHRSAYFDIVSCSNIFQIL